MLFRCAACVLCIVHLASCNAPSPEFRGLPAQTVIVDGSVFDVRRSGDTVELLRTNTQYAPTFASIIPTATRAVRIATGCLPRPASWRGEQTLMQVDMECP